MNLIYKQFLGCLWAVVCLLSLVQAQTYPDYFGTGHDVGVSVSSSDATNTNKPDHTLTGTGYLHDLKGASRFLAQASLGANYEDIQYVAQIGAEAWIDEQFAQPHTSYLATYKAIYNTADNIIKAAHPDAGFLERRPEFLSYTFYEKALKENDVLRHKVALALSQIFVVSYKNSVLRNRGFGLADYYDQLYLGAFGNYRDLLSKVTLHPVMGLYLSHFKNKKANPNLNTLPDENYAREVMQLFSIGLAELELDGTPKLDAQGNTIPTYTIEDVQELAKVFTGLSGGEWDLVLKPNNAGNPLVFHKGARNYDLTTPMHMYEQHHDATTKVLFNNTVTIAGQQTGMADIQAALDALFHHPNVGPFISYRLIQQLVKSNPSPSYVARIATVFNNNSKGIRGDLKAVVKAILLDPEARDCQWESHPQAGKLRQPIERFTNLFLAFDINSPSGKLWFKDNYLYSRTEQSFLASPSVFNFFSPFFAEASYIAPQNLKSPEFQILNSVSSIHYLNTIEGAVKTRPFSNITKAHNNRHILTQNNAADAVSLDFADEIAAYQTGGATALVDRLNLLLCHGQLSDGSKSIIVNAINKYANTINNYSGIRAVKDALYFIMITPDYTILK